MLSIKSHGDFRNLEKYLKKSIGKNYDNILRKYGEEGVAALSTATPVDTGLTAVSWGYKIEKSEDEGYISIIWYNTNVVNGVNIALILQNGHATRNGGWVDGVDYINPALQPIFDSLAAAAWKEVNS